jgi:hypothetical protein
MNRQPAMKHYLIACLLAFAGADRPPPPLDNLGAIAADLLGDPPGFDRGLLPEVDRRIVGFLRARLLP